MSLRRSSLQFNIRPWRISALGNPLLRLGLPRSIRQSRVAGGALGARRKRAWGSPQRPRNYGRRMGWIALCLRPSKASRSRSCGPPPQHQHASSRAVATLTDCVDAALRASPRASRRAFSALARVPFSPRGQDLPLGKVNRVQRAAKVVPRRLDEHAPQCLLPALVMPPCRTLSHWSARRA